MNATVSRLPAAFASGAKPFHSDILPKPAPHPHRAHRALPSLSTCSVLTLALAAAFEASSHPHGRDTAPVGDLLSLLKQLQAVLTS